MRHRVDKQKVLVSEAQTLNSHVAVDQSLLSSWGRREVKAACQEGTWHKMKLQ